MCGKTYIVYRDVVVPVAAPYRSPAHTYSAGFNRVVAVRCSLISSTQSSLAKFHPEINFEY